MPPQPHAPRFGDHDAARVRFRRAVTLLLMTLVLPGSAQLVAGNRKVGRIALRVCLALARHPDRRRPARPAVARPHLLPGQQHVHARTAAAGAVRRRRRLGAAVLRRLASRPAARAAAEAAARGGRAQQRAGVLRGGLAAVRRAHGRGAADVHRHDVRRRPGDRGDPRPLQRAAARRRLRRRPLGPAPRQPLGGEHRPGDRPRHPVRAAAQHDELPVRRGLDHGRAVPGRLRLRGLRAEQPRHLGGRQQGPVQGLRQPGRRGDHRGRRGHHRADDQLLRDGEPRRASAAWCRPSAA